MKGKLMPDRKRIMLEVYVDLDPIPGAMHTEASARAIIQTLLDSGMSHYNPRVTIKE
jgi:hypothetical protein